MAGQLLLCKDSWMTQSTVGLASTEKYAGSAGSQTVLPTLGPGSSHTDRLTRNHHFDSPVLLPAGGCIVGSHRVGLSIADRAQGRHGHALRRQIIAHRVSALFRQLLIIFVAADAVGVAFQLDFEARISQQDA